MKVYICPMCLNTLVRCKDTRKGTCPDCRYSYKLAACGIADRTASPDCIEVRA